jgi:hypothetical protein
MTIEFNKTAYNNESLMDKFIEEDLLPVLDKRMLLVIDQAAFHKTPEILSKLRSHSILLAVMPGGCTSLLQPLNISINKPFKEWLRDEMELILDEYKARDEIASTLRERRIITTQIFCRAWRRLCSTAHRKLIIDSFIHTGIKIAPDGSKHHRIRVKDHIDI